MATIGDIVLIYRENSPAFFARIEGISADKKPGWYQVRLLILQVPVAEVVWILREPYIDGEVFTMNGIQLRLEKVRASSDPQDKSGPDDEGGRSRLDTGGSKVISLLDRKKD